MARYFFSPLLDNAVPTTLLAAILSLIYYFPTAAHAASAEEWRQRSIYQVMTDRFAMSDQGGHYSIQECQDKGMFCGGTWKGLMENLDYIQGMNFNAIWVSPVVANLPQHTVDGEAYAGYWSQDLYGLNENYGVAADLQALVGAMHDRGMYFMMDVAPNHMGYNGNVTDPIDYSVFSPFNDEKYYHPYCEMDYSGANSTALQQCWLGSDRVPLVDLRTEDDEVFEMFSDWIQWMVKTYNLDGLRIDAGVNVGPEFLQKFVKAAGVWATAEVYIDDPDVACEYQDAMGSVLNYPLYWPMTSAFQDGGSFSDLADMMATQIDKCPDVTTLTTFTENQDVPRFGNHTQDIAHARNIVAFATMGDGIPVIYQGVEQHFTGGTDPFTNREPLWMTEFNVFPPLYEELATLNTLRSHLARTDDNYITTETNVLSTSSDFMVLSKGKGSNAVVSVLTNDDQDASSNSVDVSDSPYSSGTELYEILTCNTITTGDGGSFSSETTGGEPRIYVPSSMLENSSLCGFDGKKYAQSSITVSTTSTVVATTAAGGKSTTTTAAATMPVLETSNTALVDPTAGAAASLRAAESSLSWLVAPASILAVVLGNGLIGGAVFGIGRRR